MDQNLAQLSTHNQKDKAAAYLSLLHSIFTQQENLAHDIHALVDHLINQDAGIIAGRQVLSELVKGLTSATIPNSELRKAIVEDVLSIVQLRTTSYEEQVNLLKFELADILEKDEDWSSAARVLRGINLEASQRSDEEKLRVYVRIVRLLLEEEDSVQAETLHNRATSLIHSTSDRELLLCYKLCHARISDYARKFLEAASRYHELSFFGEIDEDERRFMLSAAVTCAVLAPAGPNRSRILSSLCRDERTAELPTYSIKEFEKTLKPHQLAKISLSTNDWLSSTLEDGDFVEGASTRTGPTTVLDRAVMEHNVLASSRIYNNITFSGLGALLDLTPGAAETMARKMIEQGRLKGHIDQVDKLIWFEAAREEDNAQGKAGGLGDVNQETEDTGSLFTKRWDKQIRMTAAHVETLVQNLVENGLIRSTAVKG
ncbi:hypothetical protein BGW80DRAFT_1435518 [Lactifluus volemus]|nr:hypothetical protein BGW80DRAFT_1435518 [Lactifluus volemus]